MCITSDGMLVALHDIGDSFMSIRVRVLSTTFADDRGDSQEGGSLEEDDLFRVELLRKCMQKSLDIRQVGYHLVHDSSPGLVQRLIPDTRSERFKVQAFCPLNDQLTSLFVDSFAVFVLY